MNKKLQSALNQFKQTILLQAHPIGSVYMSFDNVDPSTLFGGLWQLLDEGKFLRSTTTTAGTSGGADTVRLTRDNIPTLDVAFDIGYNEEEGKSNSVGIDAVNGPSDNVGWWMKGAVQLTGEEGSYTSRSGTLSANLNSEGEYKTEDQIYPVDIVPSHITVYMWKRVG